MVQRLISNIIIIHNGIRIETHGTGQSLRMTEQYRFNFYGVAMPVCMRVCIQSYVYFQGLAICKELIIQASAKRSLRIITTVCMYTNTYIIF